MCQGAQFPLRNRNGSYMNMRTIQPNHYHKVHQHSKSQALDTLPATADPNERRNTSHHRTALDDVLAVDGVETRLGELSHTLMAESSVSPSVTAPRPNVRLCRSNCSRSRRCRNSRSCVFCSRSCTNSSVSCLICST